jgi:hypothetical protein
MTRTQVLIAAVGIPSALLSAAWILLILEGSASVDWRIYVEASHRVGSGGLYQITGEYAFRASPFLAWGFAFLAPMGATLWRVLHLAAAAAMPSWPLRLAVLISWPFWFDVQEGNVLTFALLAAAWAIRGSRVAGVIYLALALLMPRPLFLPVAAWLLWQRPDLRLPFAAMLVAHTAAVVVSGWGGEWLRQLFASTDEIHSFWNLGPSRLIGLWGLVIGIPLAAWLTVRGRLGLASLAISPYWLPYYFLFLLLDLPFVRIVREPEPRVATAGAPA